jgi:subtilisin family serine protease
VSKARHHFGLAIWIFVASFFLLPTWADARDDKHRLRKAQHAPGELLIKYKRSVRSAAYKYRRSSRRFATLRRFRSVGVLQVKIPEGMTLEEALDSCRQDPEVEYAEPNYVRHISVDPVFPDDEHFDELWGLHNTEQWHKSIEDDHRGLDDADMDAPEAWDVQTGSRNVVVAVLDTGVDWGHEDLAANIWINPGEINGEDGVDDDGNGYVDDIRGWDFVPKEGDNDPVDDNGHGTHVSGTIGAEGDNGIGITGVTWAVSIMPLKTLDKEGTGTVAEEIEAIEYAIANGAKIINASFSGEDYSKLEYDAIKSAQDARILLVAAAGNNGSNNDDTPEYPASYNLNNIIAVAATDHNDRLAHFSNYGALTVDVAAPGVDIYSTKTDNSYSLASGTSMAAPHVSGLAALIWSQNLGFMYSEVKGFIFYGVDVLDPLAGKILKAGRINANASILAADSGAGDVPDFPPSDLVVEAASARQLNLTWTDNASDETGTRIERATKTGGPFSHVGTVAANVESYADVTVNDLTTYFYRVLAFNVAGVTDPSNTDSATTPFAAPDNLWATAASSSRIDLFWSDNSAGESGYRIERKTGAAGTYSQIATVGPNVDTFKDTGLGASTTYYYRVRGFTDQEVSPYSNEISAETSAVLTASSVPPVGDGGGGGGGCFISACVAFLTIPADCFVTFRCPHPCMFLINKKMIWYYKSQMGVADRSPLEP